MAPTPPPIRACLFDMDGLLIDSEDKYTVCTNAVLHHYGRPSLPWHIKAQMQGRPASTAGPIFTEWAHLPVGPDEYMQMVKEQQRIHFPTCKPLPGVEELLRTLKERTEVEMALATSSVGYNYELKTGHLGELFGLFEEESKILGDDTRIAKGRGKPAPDIYLLALETVNERLRRQGKKEVLPEQCLVFEDSVPGVEAGRRAGMQVVWCPHPGLLEEMKGKEQMILAGLMGEHKDDGEVVEHDGRGRRRGAPGEVDDGWGRFLPTLEGFPYEAFGIRVV
jgi:pseudouridine 5'-phosphatase